jgi:hypothetical protein
MYDERGDIQIGFNQSQNYYEAVIIRAKIRHEQYNI